MKRTSRLVSAAVLTVLVSGAPLQAWAAVIAAQYDTSVLSTVPGDGIQRLGTGLSGSVAAVALKFTQNDTATMESWGYPRVQLNSCPGSSYIGCSTVIVFNNWGDISHFAYNSHVGDVVEASVFKDYDQLTSTFSDVPYALNPLLYYSLDIAVAPNTGTGYFYGSPSASSYAGGSYLPGGAPDATVKNVAFALCDTHACSLVAPDTTAPALSITSAPTSTSPTPTITGTTDDPASVGITLNEKTYLATPSAGAWSVTIPAEDALAEGSYTITASSTDAVGNVGSATQAFVFDATAPAISINSGPAEGSFASTSAIAFSFTATDPHLASVVCSYDNLTPESCAGSYATSTLSDGAHTFTIAAADTLGNSASLSRSFIKDTTSPTVTAASASSTSATPTLSGTTDDAAAVSVTIHGKTYLAAPSGSAWSVVIPLADALTDGSYAITAQSTDAAGNPSAPASATLAVDLTDPDVAITGGPAEGAYASSTPSISFTASDANLSSVTCFYDSGAPEACMSPYAPTLADGTHTFTLTAEDSFGHSASASRTFILDTAAPVLAEVSPIAAGTDTTPEYTFTSSEAGALAVGGSCSSSAATAAAGTNTITFDTLAPGTYSDCTVAVTDAAGNRGTLAVTAFTVTTPPSSNGGSGGGVGGGVVSGPLSVGYQIPPPAPIVPVAALAATAQVLASASVALPQAAVAAVEAAITKVNPAPAPAKPAQDPWTPAPQNPPQLAAAVAQSDFSLPWWAWLAGAALLLAAVLWMFSRLVRRR